MPSKIIDLQHLNLFKQQIEQSISSNSDLLVDRLIDNASYNILPNEAENTEEAGSGVNEGSIDWRVLDDGSIRLVKNTYTSSVTKYLIINNSFKMYSGKYTLFGCAKGGANNKYWIEVNVNNQTYKDIGHGIQFTLNDTYNAQIRIGICVEATNLIFYPMIVRGETDLLTYVEPTFGDQYPGYVEIDGSEFYDGESVYFYMEDPETNEVIGPIKRESISTDPNNQVSAIKEQNLYTPYYPTNVELAEMVDKLSERDIDVATTLAAGIVKPDGTTITIDQDGTIHGATTVDIATTSTVGTVKPDDDTIGIDSNGTIKANKATTANVGVVKPDGTTITVDSDGTIHGVAETPTATTSTAGIVKPDGTTITINNGTISAEQTPIATSSVAGKVKPDNDSITVDANGVISTNLTHYTTSELNTMWGNALTTAGISNS